MLWNCKCFHYWHLYQRSVDIFINCCWYAKQRCQAVSKFKKVDIFVYAFRPGHKEAVTKLLVCKQNSFNVNIDFPEKSYHMSIDSEL